jgi:hypothetical protein
LYERGEIHRPEFSTEVHHLIPHNGDPKKFFCGVQGLAGLCKRHHSEVTARENGQPVDPDPIVPTGAPGRQFAADGVPDDLFASLMADVLKP